MPGKHALFSPSGFKALMLCPAKPAMERGLPDASNAYADEGTAAHFLASYCLEIPSLTPHDCLGKEIAVHDDGAEWLGVGALLSSDEYTGPKFTVDQDMADAVQTYIDTVCAYAGDDGEVLVEQALPIGHITGEEGAEGTGDTVILRGAEIIVIDLKYGRGVEVSAIENPQLMLYGLGALEKYELMGDFERVRMVISQPRVNQAPSEFDMTVPALIEWGQKHADPAAARARAIYDADFVLSPPHAFATPHPDACRFCKAKSTCPALAASVQQAMGAEFTDLTTQDDTARHEIVEKLVKAVPDEQLGAKLDAVEIVEMWCKAMRGRGESVLLAGGDVPGWKLVPGKKGNRQWTDEDEAGKTLHAIFRNKDKYTERKLMSPTSIEKVLKAQPKRWARVQPLIKQADGKPSIAPVSDPRPALVVQPVESEFKVIAPEGVEDLV